MGMSVEKINARRKLPWPRYRVSIWNPINFCWRDLPDIYYSAEEVLYEARMQSARCLGKDKVRICTMLQDGTKHDRLLREL